MVFSPTEPLHYLEVLFLFLTEYFKNKYTESQSQMKKEIDFLINVVHFNDL